jgi:hypothetical protein
MFRIRKHFWLLSTGKWYFSIAFVSKSFVSDSNVRRSTLFYANSVVNGVFNTHIHQRKSRTMQQVLQEFGTIYIEGYRRVLEITTDILNIMSNKSKYGSCGFCFKFSFQLVFTLYLHVFAAAFKVFFGYFIQNKVLSLSVFKSYLRIFMFRFIRTFRRVSFGMELS